MITNYIEIKLLTNGYKEGNKKSLLKLENIGQEILKTLTINTDSVIIETIITELKKIKINKKVKDINSVKKLIYKIDLRQVFHVNIRLNKKISLDLFKNYNTGYFINTENGIKLFLDNNDEDYFKISLNLINIYMLITNKTYMETIKELMQMFDIEISQKLKNKEKKESLKYANNIKFIRDLEKYPNLKKYIQKDIFSCEIIQFINLETAFINAEYKNNNIFYISVRKLREKIEEYEHKLNIIVKSKSIGHIQGLLIFLKLTNILEEVPEEYQVENNIVINDNTVFDTGCYIANFLDNKILKNADMIAEKLINNKININNLTLENITKVFGYKTSVEICKNGDMLRKYKIFKDKKKEENKEEIKEDFLF